MKLKHIFSKIDNIAPEPWKVDGVVQVRPIYQLMFLLGVIVGIVIVCFFKNIM